MYEEECHSVPGEECGQVCLSLHQPECSSVGEERCVELETTQCVQTYQEVCGDIEVAECEPRTFTVRDQRCNSSLVRLCGRPQPSLACHSRTEEQCFTVPDVHCQVEH